jgi:hypothetical protein
MFLSIIKPVVLSNKAGILKDKKLMISPLPVFKAGVIAFCYLLAR